MILLSLILGVVVIGCNSFVLSPILADVAGELGTDPVTIARVISVYGAATAISSFFLSGLADRFGARAALMSSTAIMALALAISAASPTWPVLAASQAMAGLAGGVLLPAIYATATAFAAPGQSSRMLGRVLTGWSLSLVAGVPLAALTADLASWRLAYAVLAVLALATTAGFRSLPSRAPDAARPPRERLARVLQAPGVRPLLVICLCFMAAFYGTCALIGDHARNSLGVDAALASTIALAYGLGFGLAGTLGASIDRIGPDRLFGPALLAASLVYLVLPPATASLPTALAGAFLWGGINHLVLNMLVQQLAAANPAARAQVLGLNSTATYTAVFLGPLMMSVLYIDWGFGAVARLGALLVFIAAIVRSVSSAGGASRWSRYRRRS